MSKIPDSSKYEEIDFYDMGYKYRATFHKKGQKQTNKIYYANHADTLIEGIIKKDKFPFNIRVRGEVKIANTVTDMENMMAEALRTDCLKIRSGVLYVG